MNVDTGEFQALNEHVAELEDSERLLIRVIARLIPRPPEPAPPELRLIKGGRP